MKTYHSSKRRPCFPYEVCVTSVDGSSHSHCLKKPTLVEGMRAGWHGFLYSVFQGGTSLEKKPKAERSENESDRDLLVDFAVFIPATGSECRRRSHAM